MPSRNLLGRRTRNSLLALLLAPLALLLPGCNETVAPKAVTGLSISGTVHGGQQAVTGSSLQLYAVGTTGDASAATTLLAAPITTDSTGSFNLTGLYTCPSAGSRVYIVATGGNPGLTAGTNNPELAMMAALGTCSALQQGIFISLNELTTVGSLATLSPYMSGYTKLGSGTSDLTAFNTAFSMVNDYTDVGSGAVPGPALPANYDASSTELNTLGDILAACVNSFGGVAGDGSACGTIFALTHDSGKPAPTDTIAAALYILQNPTKNYSSLITLIPPASPFQPVLVTAPTSWTPVITPKVQTPVITPGTGTYSSLVQVAITDATSGSTINYTIDGSTPTSNSPLYGAALNVTATTVVKAIASYPAYVASNVASATFTFTLPSAAAPVFSIAAGTYTTAQTLKLTSATSGSSIYYTIDGSVPTTASTPYSAPFSVAASETVNAVAIASGFSLSPVSSAVYHIHPSSVSRSLFTFAGTPSAGGTPPSSTPTPALSVGLAAPSGVVVDSAGNVYIADTYQDVVEKVTTDGNLTLFAGTLGTAFYSGDGGQAASATLNHPAAVALDTAGNVYISDTNNNVIRKVTAAGIISTVAGSCIYNGTSPCIGYYSGDGGPATSAKLNNPGGLALDAAGNIYVADYANDVVRKITASTGTISTYAGNPTANGSCPQSAQPSCGDGGPALGAYLSSPSGVALDALGNLYITDTGDYRVRKVTPTGTIGNFAGGGYSMSPQGDGGLATDAALYPVGIATDSAGDIFITDFAAGPAVREITPDGLIATPVPNIPSYQITGLAVDANGNIFIADSADSLILEAAYYDELPVTAAPTFSLAAGTYTDVQTLSLATTTVGAAIYYTTDGTTPTSNSMGYTGPIGISATQVVQAIAVISTRQTSPVSSAIYTVHLTAATPAASLAGGAYPAPVTVSLSSATTGGATIHYTLDGSTPTSASPTYSQPLNILVSTTVRAVAQKTGYADSAIPTFIYTITACDPPAFSVAAGPYLTTQTVQLSTQLAGTSIFYTINGTTPTTASTPYTGPITVSASETINAISTRSGYTTSAVSTAAYLINVALTAPTFSLAAGTYLGSQELILTPARVGDSLFYTVNGTAPTSGSTPYTGPIVVAASETVTAVAVASGYRNSPSAAAAYVIQPDTTAIITTVAGAGEAYYLASGLPTGSGGQAIAASVYLGPVRGYLVSGSAIATDASGDIFLMDYQSASIQKITPAGVFSTIAGTGVNAMSSGTGTATAMSLYYPTGMTADKQGNVYYSDAGSQTIRKITPAGQMSIIATSIFVSSVIYNPTALAVDSQGNVYSVNGYTEIVKTDTSGNSTIVISQGNSPFSEIKAMAVDPVGNIYVLDYQVPGDGVATTLYLKKVALDLTITTIAGQATPAHTGDGGPASAASLLFGEGLGIDSAGNIYIAEDNSGGCCGVFPPNYIRKINPSGIISTIAGSGASWSAASPGGDGGPALSANLNPTIGLAVDNSGNVLFGDAGRVRKLTFGPASTTQAAQPDFTPYIGYSGYDGSTASTSFALTITSATPGAAIHYTLDGTTPTAASPTYTGPVNVTLSGTTVQAISTASGLTASPVNAENINVLPVAPVISPATGSFTAAQNVTITAQAGAVIYYTLDGTTPTTPGTQSGYNSVVSQIYTGSLNVSKTTTVSAVAYFNGRTSATAASTLTFH